MSLSCDFKNHQKFVKRLSLSAIPVALLLFIIPALSLYFGISMNFLALVIFLSNTYQILFSFYYALQFACASLAIRARFKLINEYLQRFVTIFRTFNHKAVLADVKSFNLEAFAELHNDLCDAIEMINSTFTMQIVVVMTSLLLNDVFSGYEMLQGYLSGSSHLLPFLILTNLLWIILQYAVKILIAHSGSSTTNEAEKSISFVVRLITTRHLDKELKKDLNYLLVQMRCRNKNLQNWFFSINWNLVLTVSVLDIDKLMRHIYF